MVHLDLSDEEQSVLVQILESEFADVRAEVMETESHDYKQQLLHREEVIRKLLEALGHPIGKAKPMA